jgi:hypothetical protein
LGKPPAEIRRTDRITVGGNEDGRQELFVMGRDAALWRIWQVAPNVGWGDWENKVQRVDRVLKLWKGHEERLVALDASFADQVVARVRRMRQ